MLEIIKKEMRAIQFEIEAEKERMNNENFQNNLTDLYYTLGKVNVMFNLGTITRWKFEQLKDEIYEMIRQERSKNSEK